MFYSYMHKFIGVLQSIDQSINQLDTGAGILQLYIHTSQQQDVLHHQR